MKPVRLWLAAPIGTTLAVLMMTMGATRASAQSAVATPTPTPGTCSLAVPQATGTPAQAQCRIGAEPPPSLLGVSGGNINSVSANGLSCCTGTFGAELTAGGVDYVLSTNNVLARASGGTNVASKNERIVQPGLVDLGCFQDNTDTVARLTSWVPLSFGSGVNTMDAAIARVVQQEQMPSGSPTAGIDPLGNTLNIGQISTTPFPFTNLIDAIFVMKMGRGSCLTSGLIDAFDAIGKVVYPPKTCNALNKGTALFDHQILVFGEAFPPSNSAQGCPFAAHGDSGALVVTLTQQFVCPQAVGIVFAETPSAGTSFGPQTDSGIITAVTPIQTILSKFKGFSLVGDGVCTPGPPLNAPLTGAFKHVGSEMPQVSDARRASINAVRAVKVRVARSLLKHEHVNAVAIGSGDAPDTAALLVYVDDNSPKTLAMIPKRIGGVQVKIKHAGKFEAL